jgi:hypothetical protein
MKASTHLGNSLLHKRHSVMIEGGQIPRAKVMNQMLIDHWLMHGEINLVEHQAGEYLLGQAARAGVWPTGVDLSGTRVQGSVGNYIPANAFPFGRTLILVKKKYGWFHSYLVREVVCFGWDVSKNEFRMDCVKQALNWIAKRRMGGGKDPLRILRTAAEGKV